MGFIVFTAIGIGVYLWVTQDSRTSRNSGSHSSYRSNSVSSGSAGRSTGKKKNKSERSASIPNSSKYR